MDDFRDSAGFVVARAGQFVHIRRFPSPAAGTGAGSAGHQPGEWTTRNGVSSTFVTSIVHLTTGGTEDLKRRLQKRRGQYSGARVLSLVGLEVLPICEVDYVLQHGGTGRQVGWVQELRVKVIFAVRWRVDQGAALEGSGCVLGVIQVY